MILEAQPDITGVAGMPPMDNKSSTSQLDSHQDVVLMDVRMPRLDEIQATKRLFDHPSAEHLNRQP